MLGFVLPNLIGLLVAPTTLLVLAATFGLVLLLSGGRRVARALLAIGVGGLFAVLLLPVQQWLLLPLEDRFPRPLPPGRVDGVVVLGGALEAVVSAERGIPSLNGAAERMTEFVALARRYPQARLVFTGGDASVLTGGMREADIARVMLADLGVDPMRVTFETAARNTYENAVDTARLVPHATGQTWLLVTSAQHMPRSVGVFRHVGWDVTPWPVGYKAMRNPAQALLQPAGTKLAAIDLAAHEWFGLIAYRIAGRTDALLPGP